MSPGARPSSPPPGGRFVVLEGADGCGKTTQVARLAARLRDAGREVVTTREPGATAAGTAIRAVVLDGGPIDPRTEALLVAADRAEHVAAVVRPALARGAVVVSDRYVPSSLAYQGVARGLGVEVVERLSEWATGGLRPDVVVVLDIGAGEAAARRDGVRDRLEQEPDRFQHDVRRAYRELAARYGWVVVDGRLPVDAVTGAVWAAVEPVLEARR